MRSEKELFELMLEHQDMFRDGLCHWFLCLWAHNLISDEESLLIDRYIKNNKPFLSLFRTDDYYWSMCNIEPRIKWINKQIKKLSK